MVLRSNEWAVYATAEDKIYFVNQANQCKAANIPVAMTHHESYSNYMEYTTATEWYAISIDHTHSYVTIFNKPCSSH